MPAKRVSETPPPLETWRGCCNAWDCDEMGHMNVRHYVGRWSEGLAALAASLGLPRAFAAEASDTIIPVDQHIRFLAEARAGDPLAMRAGVLAHGETDATIYQELRHADGRLAATYVTRVQHVDAVELRPFAWSQRTRPLLAQFACKAPAESQARSIALDAVPAADASLARAEALGMPTTGRGLVQRSELDAFGRARPDLFIGRISDAAPNIFAAWRAEAAQAAGGGERFGGAVVEYRVVYRGWPRDGALIEIRSGVVEVAEKFQRLVHWALDPVSGAAYATAEAVALTFDLRTRKAVAPDAARRAALAERIVPGLTI